MIEIYIFLIKIQTEMIESLFFQSFLLFFLIFFLFISHYRKQSGRLQWIKLNSGKCIAAADGLGELDPVLRETAEARLMDKEASLKELSERLHISKSCLNHRLRRLEKIARSYPEEE